MKKRLLWTVALLVAMMVGIHGVAAGETRVFWGDLFPDEEEKPNPFTDETTNPFAEEMTMPETEETTMPETEETTVPETEETTVPETEEKAYPYTEDGYWHYGIRLDGEILELPHDALIAVENNSENEILYPVTDVLDLFGVTYYWSEETGEFSTVVNGISASRDPADGNYMWFTNMQDGYGNSITPMNIDGVYYAPNFFFEHTIGATLTKVAKGKEDSLQYVNIVTGAAYEWGPGAVNEAIMRWNEKCYEITLPTGWDGWETAQPRPAAGQIYRSTAYGCEDLSLTVKVANAYEEQGTLLKIYTESGDLVSCLMIDGASSQTVKLPAGKFEIRVGSGEEWYGMYLAFGESGSYQQLLFDDGGKIATLKKGGSYELTLNSTMLSPEESNVGTEGIGRNGF